MDTQAMTGTRILQFLKSLSLFEGLGQDSLDALVRASHFKQVPKGSYLFFQSDPGMAVYLVWKGAVVIQLENLDGRELIINEMYTGECFGELGILTEQPHSTSAVASVDSEILVISQTAFLAVLRREPDLVLRLLEITARRLQESSRREEALAFHDAQQRLACLLLTLDAAVSARGYVTLSQEEVAQRAGLTRQTAATILGRWRRRGWLLTGRGHIVLLNRRELNLLCARQESVVDI